MPVRPDIYIHEKVERRRKRIRHDVQFPKLGTQIVVTVRVVARCAVLDAIHLEATRRIEKVVSANVVGDDGQHRFTAIGPYQVAPRKIDLPAVVERTSVRKALASILRKGDQIAALSALRIDDPQPLAALEVQPRTTRGRNELLHGEFLLRSLCTLRVRKRFGLTELYQSLLNESVRAPAAIA